MWGGRGRVGDRRGMARTEFNSAVNVYSHTSATAANLVSPA